MSDIKEFLAKSVLIPTSKYDEVAAMQRWCEDHGWKQFTDFVVGWHPGYKYNGNDMHWSFKDEKHLTLFTLRWA